MVRVTLRVMLATAAGFSLAFYLSGASVPTRDAIFAVWAVAVPLVLLQLALALVRHVVAREDGLEVDGELFPWTATTAPKLAFLSTLGGVSRPARAWLTVSTPDGTRNLMIIADPACIAEIARLRELDGVVRPHGSAYR